MVLLWVQNNKSAEKIIVGTINSRELVTLTCIHMNLDPVSFVRSFLCLLHGSSLNSHNCIQVWIHHTRTLQQSFADLQANLNTTTWNYLLCAPAHDHMLNHLELLLLYKMYLCIACNTESRKLGPTLTCMIAGDQLASQSDPSNRSRSSR